MRVLLSAALAAWLPLAAAAQQPVGPPIPLLTPPSAPENPPATSLPASPPPEPAEPGRTITAEPLAPPGPGWSGDLSPPAGALPSDLWRGTPRPLAETLLALLPDTTSPALQALVRRLLLSPGAAPAGTDPPGAETRLAGLRAAALLRLGEADAVRKIIAAAPDKQRSALQPLLIEADAVEGRADAACDKVAAAIRQDQSVFWQRALVECQVLRAETEKATLGLQLLVEQERAAKVEPEHALAIAVAALAGHSAPPTVDKLDHADPLLICALAAAKRRLAPALVATLRADLALTLARDEQADPESRLLAAERAAALGAMPPRQLRDLYTSAASEVPAPGRGDSGLERARRFAAIGTADTAAERLADITAFADLFPAREDGGLLLAARLVAPELHKISPNPGLANAAPAAARLLIAAGEYDAAAAWLPLEPKEGAELRAALALAKPGADKREAETKRPTLLALRLALGAAVAAEEWTHLPAAAWTAPGPPSPPLAPWLDLADAAAAKRVAETALAAVLVAAPQGTIAKDPAALYAAVKALDRVGLAADARAFAVEAALVR